MMYRIDTNVSKVHYKRLSSEFAGNQKTYEETIFSLSISRDCKDAEEVQKAIPHLLDMISEGKAKSIKITKL